LFMRIRKVRLFGIMDAGSLKRLEFGCCSKKRAAQVLL
jgi:hypothetical protein